MRSSLGQRLRTAFRNTLHRFRCGANGSRVQWRGSLTVDPAELARELRHGWQHDGIDGWVFERVAPGRIILAPNPNLVVNSGVQNSLDLLFGLGGTALQTMGVDDGASNPVAGTTDSTAGSTNRRLVTLASTARASEDVTCDGTFTDANVSFVMKRLFLSEAAAGTTDSAGDLYAMTDVFTIDLTAFSSWSQTFTATVTGTGS